MIVAAPANTIVMALQPMMTSPHLMDSGLPLMGAMSEALARQRTADGTYGTSAAFLANLSLDALTHVSIEILSQATDYTAACENKPRVFVNVSPLTLCHPEQAEVFLTALQSHRSQAKSIVIEVTEQKIPAELLLSFRRTLSAIYNAGFCLAVDDYQIRDESPHQEVTMDYARYIKVRLPDLRAQSENIQEAFRIGARENFRHKGQFLIIEQIETEDDMAFANLFQPDFLQGYLYAKPAMPVVTPAHADDGTHYSWEQWQELNDICEKRNLARLENFFTDTGLSINTTEIFCNATLLGMTIRHDWPAGFDYCLEHGADINQQDKNGQTVYLDAKRSRLTQHDYFGILIERGLLPSRADMAQIQQLSSGPMHG